MAFDVTYKDNDPHWFAAYTHVHQERKTAERLASMGIESFVPVRQAKHKWSDRIKVVEELLIPNMIFVHCTELKRIDTLRFVPQIFAYMNHRGPYNPAIIPDLQMLNFQRICKVGQDRVTFSKFAVGDRVKIIRGPLAGMEGLLTRKGNLHSFSIKVEKIGFATVDIKPDDIEPLPGRNK